MPTVVRIHLSPHFFIDFRFFLQENLASGSSSFGRAIAFQAIGGGFEPRLPLEIKCCLGVNRLSNIFICGKSNVTNQNGRKVLPL